MSHPGLIFTPVQDLQAYINAQALTGNVFERISRQTAPGPLLVSAMHLPTAYRTRCDVCDGLLQRRAVWRTKSGVNNL